MDSKRIIEIALGAEFTEEDLKEELYEICESLHSSCSGEDCPVRVLNGGEAPRCKSKNFDEDRGCACFKSGTAMLEFIRKHGG